MPTLFVVREATEMFGETHYQWAYQRGVAWAEELFSGWLRTGRPVPHELPATKHDATAVLGPSPVLDLDRQARTVAVLYATARVRWRRLVSLEYGRRAG